MVTRKVLRGLLLLSEKTMLKLENINKIFVSVMFTLNQFGTEKNAPVFHDVLKVFQHSIYCYIKKFVRYRCEIFLPTIRFGRASERPLCKDAA